MLSTKVADSNEHETLGDYSYQVACKRRGIANLLSKIHEPVLNNQGS